MSKSKETFKIKEPVGKLPGRAFPKKAKVYDELLEAIDKKPDGIYPVEVAGKKPMSVYVALNKRTKGRKDIKLHLRQGTVYIEKL